METPSKYKREHINSWAERIDHCTLKRIYIKWIQLNYWSTSMKTAQRTSVESILATSEMKYDGKYLNWHNTAHIHAFVKIMLAEIASSNCCVNVFHVIATKELKMNWMKIVEVQPNRNRVYIFGHIVAITPMWYPS